MNKALQIISIQHELVLTLDATSDLDKMLQQFLRICNSRLNLISSHIFLYHNKDNKPCNKISCSNDTEIKHFVSIPKLKNGQPWFEDSILLDNVIKFDNSNEEHKKIEANSQFFQFFKIKNSGIMAIEYQGKLSATLKQTLEPVLERLCISCSASINHNALKKEVEARKAAEEIITYQAMHDDLTGLYNRRELTKQLENVISTYKKKDGCGALLFIDLNDFKSINDLMGHHIGDKVLYQVAERLTNIIPPENTIARFGGDEFIVLIKNLHREKADDEVQSMIQEIIKEIEKPFILDDSSYSLSCSAGYDIFSDYNTSAIELIKNADLAMYEAKHTGATRGLVYNKTMSDKLDQKLSYSAELKRALERNEFELHYQPQFDDSNNIIGAEALLRWNNPDRGYESPAIYIPIAEQSDLIIHISEWVLHQACKDIKRLEEEYQLPESFKKISINISAKHLAKDNFVDSILSAIEQHKIHPHHFAIEITEGIMVGDVERSIEMLEDLRAHHIECSIDDFGTGYSSLTYLKKLPANLIKIDRAFVQDIHKDSDNRSIAKMIIGLGENLNMDIIAEGVENQDEVDCLSALGCNQYQGFFFCKPIPFNQLTERIIASGNTHLTQTSSSQHHQNLGQ